MIKSSLLHRAVCCLCSRTRAPRIVRIQVIFDRTTSKHDLSNIISKDRQIKSTALAFLSESFSQLSKHSSSTPTNLPPRPCSINRTHVNRMTKVDSRFQSPDRKIYSRFSPYAGRGADQHTSHKAAESTLDRRARLPAYTSEVKLRNSDPAFSKPQICQ